MRTMPAVYDVQADDRPINSANVGTLIKCIFGLAVLTLGEPDLLSALVRLVLTYAR